ncbi:NAD(P)H-dependent oxidoreductase [Geomesophilobacter sediminis]|uniref:Flavodoxin family protein n=1 Tax=Geomesophilobacter sediminis TaxID=2798584 RepID=A0A8J7JLJ0_9BACT|nr:flavodoxin family protein [Geomesophilobacter sediminis]
MMKIIGFTGSPRREGNTAWTIDKILEGAKEKGAQTQSWYFSDLDIRPCGGCLGCHRGDHDRGKTGGRPCNYAFFPASNA